MTTKTRLILTEDGERAYGRLADSIARTLDDLLRKDKVKQRELAERAGMNEAAVSRVLDGSRNVEIRTVGALAGALGYVFDVVPKRIRAHPNDHGNRHLPARTDQSGATPSIESDPVTTSHV